MKDLLLFLAVITSSLCAIAQDAKAIFSAERVVFYGLDFSKAKFSIPDAKASEIKNVLIPTWNTMVVTDNERFPKESAFQKLNVSGDPTSVERRNAAINIENAMGSTDAALTPATIQEVVSDYKDGYKTEGIGVVFIVESFSKKDISGVAQVVFFDISTRKVLLAKRLSATPRGAGLRNYWTGAIQVMFENIIKSEFDLWKKEVMKK